MSDLFAEVADLVLGGGGNELITKMNPAQSDLAADRKKRKVTAGLSAVGATAGAAGLALGGKNLTRAYRGARSAQKADFMFHAPKARLKAVKSAVGGEKFATGLIPLEVAGLTGEVAATKILHGDTKKKGTLVKKNLEIPTKRSLTRAAVSNPKVQAKGKGALKKIADPELDELLSLERENVASGGHMAKPVKAWQRKNPGKDWQTGVQKADGEVDIIWNAEIAKADSDKQQIFGWASVVELDGQPVVDLQGDYISVDEMEKAGYEYVMKSRKGGDMHLRDNWSPIQKSEMIESFIVTPEKREAMGLPDSVPSGWWVGFKVQDPEVWAKVKSGERTGFSIHGHGRRSDA